MFFLKLFSEALDMAKHATLKKKTRCTETKKCTYSFPDCEVLVTSETGSGTIHTRDETRFHYGQVQCDWVIIGRPGTHIGLTFNAEGRSVMSTSMITSPNL